MIINEDMHYNFTEAILEWLGQQTEMKSLIRIAKGIQKSEAQTKEELTRLVVLGRVRKGGTKSCVTYYIPSAEQIEREKQGMASKFKPLVPRIGHSALLDRIRAERALYPSIT